MLIKQCKKCRKKKPLTEFSPSKRDRLGRKSICILCRRLTPKQFKEKWLSNHKRLLTEKRYSLKKHPGFNFPNDKSRWTWLAAMIDAESSLSLAFSKKNTSRGFQYIGRLNCASTTISLLHQMCRACFPYGKISSHHADGRVGTTRGFRRVNQFVVFSNGLRYILPKTIPYLVTKKERAIVLLNSLDLLNRHKLRKSEDRKLKKYWLRMRKMNQRGIPL